MLHDDYHIRITGRQVYRGGDLEPGEITLQTTGTYRERPGAQFIAYKEYDEDDPRVCHTAILKVEPQRLTMMRQGSDTKLILEKGRRHLCLYDTGFGTFSVGVFTSELDSTLSDRGGHLSVKYTLDVDSALSSANEIEVDLRPAAAQDP